MTGYKKAIFFTKDDNEIILNQCIIELEIPKYANVIGHDYGKFRCDKAIVKHIYNMNNDLCDDKVAMSIHYLDRLIYNSLKEKEYDPPFTYKVGEIVKPAGPFDTNESIVCSSGIHFYRDMISAITALDDWVDNIRVSIMHLNFYVSDTIEYYENTYEKAYTFNKDIYVMSRAFLSKSSKERLHVKHCDNINKFKSLVMQNLIINK